MVFENNDEFGVQTYDKDFKYLFDTFKFKVMLISEQQASKDYLQGDFFGIKEENFKPTSKIIEISTNDVNPTNQLRKEGYDMKGERVEICYCLNEVQLKDGDLIEFMENSSIGLVGEQFKVIATKIAQFRAEGSFREFIIVKV